MLVKVENLKNVNVVKKDEVIREMTKRGVVRDIMSQKFVYA